MSNKELTTKLLERMRILKSPTTVSGILNITGLEPLGITIQKAAALLRPLCYKKIVKKQIVTCCGTTQRMLYSLV